MPRTPTILTYCHTSAFIWDFICTVQLQKNKMDTEDNRVTSRYKVRTKYSH